MGSLRILLWFSLVMSGFQSCQKSVMSIHTTCSKCGNDLDCRKFLRVCKALAANVAAICSTRASFQARCAPAMLVLHKPQQLVHPASTHRSIVLQRLLSQCKGPAMEDLAFVSIFLQHSTACTYYEHHGKHIGSMFHVPILSFQKIILESFWHHFGFILDVFWMNFSMILALFWYNFWSEKLLERLSKSNTEKLPKMKPESARKVLHVGTDSKQNGHQFGC